MLHRGNHSHDSLVLLHTAVDSCSELSVYHFLLGNIYAVSEPCSSFYEIGGRLCVELQSWSRVFWNTQQNHAKNCKFVNDSPNESVALVQTSFVTPPLLPQAMLKESGMIVDVKVQISIITGPLGDSSPHYSSV